MVDDPFETGQEVVLEPGITAQDLAAMFDGLAELEIMLTADRALFVFARLQSAAAHPRVLHNLSSAVVRPWNRSLLFFDAGPRRIGLHMFLMKAIHANDVSFCRQFDTADP